MTDPENIGAAACRVLRATDATQKAQVSRHMANLWQTGKLDFGPRAFPDDRPARPPKPELRLPREMPKRGKGGSLENRIALLHAVAHIELNAIDLAWDLVARFSHVMPRPFTDDWVRIGDDEARHFMMIEERLRALGAFYGALPAHDGLWQAAYDTRHDLMARLAIVPLVLEARGLDVTPAMIRRLERFNDAKSAAALKVIYEEEVSHVRAGWVWFTYLCEQDGVCPKKQYHHLVKTHFKGALKPPFNTAARDAAGLQEEFYLPLSRN